MLASDLNNPEFVGAQNPDKLLHVEFYWHEPIDKWASEAATVKLQKKTVVKGARIPFVLIMRPGDNTSVVRTAVREDHKARWPDKWLHWQMQEGLVGDGAEVPGFKLEEWTYLNDKQDQLRELKFMRFSVVEQLAGASDGQIQKLGIGGYGLREEAKKALKERMGAQITSEMKKKDEELAQLRERMAKLEAMLAPTTSTPSTGMVSTVTEIDPSFSTSPVVVKRKGGRPKGSKNKPKV